jgi:Uma2 family endonuclease
MPTALTETPHRSDPPRKRWTRAECAAFEATGLWDQQHLELIEGELIDKMGKNRPHGNTLMLVLAWMMRVFGERYVNVEMPIDVSPEDNPTSEPEPDIIVLARPTFEITEANPQPTEIRLVIEISDSTVGFDLTTKAGLYARAGITEYWVFDIPARRLIVHRDPRNGLYTMVAAYRPEEAVAPLAAPGHEFRVSAAFGE